MTVPVPDPVLLGKSSEDTSMGVLAPMVNKEEDAEPIPTRDQATSTTTPVRGKVLPDTPQTRNSLGRTFEGALFVGQLVWVDSSSVFLLSAAAPAQNFESEQRLLGEVIDVMKVPEEDEVSGGARRFLYYVLLYDKGMHFSDWYKSSDVVALTIEEVTSYRIPEGDEGHSGGMARTPLNDSVSTADLDSGMSHAGTTPNTPRLHHHQSRGPSDSLGIDEKYWDLQYGRKHNEQYYIASHRINLEKAKARVKNVRFVKVGEDPPLYTWFFSPYPPEIVDQLRLRPGDTRDDPSTQLHICKRCFRPFASEREMFSHMTTCSVANPPGVLIWRKVSGDKVLGVVEVDGQSNEDYCENLVLFTKLFLEGKSLSEHQSNRRDLVKSFWFYVLVQWDHPEEVPASPTAMPGSTRPPHFVGYFSKEKVDRQFSHILSCIMVLPSFQRHGYGKFLVNLAFELSDRENRHGSAERPFSPSGHVLLHAVWARRILEFLDRTREEEAGRSSVACTVNIASIAHATSVIPSDIWSTLTEAGLLPSQNKLRPRASAGDRLPTLTPAKLERRVSCDTPTIEALKMVARGSGLPLEASEVYWCPPKVFREGEGDDCPVISTRRRTAAMKARKLGSPSSGSPALHVGVVWHKRSCESGGGTVALHDRRWSVGDGAAWELCIRSVINVTRLASTMSSSFPALSAVASVIFDLMSPSLASSATAPLPSVMYSWRVKALRQWIDEFKAKSSGDGKLRVSDLESLGHLDQYHYRGLVACDEVISTLGLGPDVTVLDVGCGVGGPARYISYKSGCSVVGYDVQEGLIEVGRELTEAVGLASKVDLVCGDATEDMYASANKEKYDAAFSLLVILHIPNRLSVLKAMYEALKPGGSVLIEDMIHLTEEGPFTDREEELLREMVGAHSVSGVAKYRRELMDAGFVDIEFRDLTKVWGPWSQQRSEDYEAGKERQISSVGVEHYNNRSKFYAAIAELFRGGRLGGASITMRKPTVMERRLVEGRAALTEEKMARVPMSIIETNGCTNSKVFPLADHDNWQFHFFAANEKSRIKSLSFRIWSAKSLPLRAWLWYVTDEGETKVLVDYQSKSLNALREVPDGQIKIELGSLGSLILRDDVDDSNGVGEFTLLHEGSEMLRMHFTTEGLHYPWEVPGQKDKVVHRPFLRGDLIMDNVHSPMHGYSKRYYGPNYGPVWGYRLSFMRPLSITATLTVRLA
ncbi:hypothetical protein FOZ60_010970 [Perkinsus olseni]|uniref:Histone acetyltransferase n=2 Tax=Perkinsus olseni TaxID=32597 RepID=A0A7J6NE69_PEROL|nr:hypothetical protein FOZ60_010970 [Perkinsus olseni]